MKTVLITGGSKGLGAGLVTLFLDRGYRVATCSRSETPQVKRWSEEAADRFFHETLDLIDREACKNFVNRVQEQLGNIDILVNNAGVSSTSVLPLATAESIDQVVDLNLKSTMYMSHLVTRQMLSLGWGRVINISSIVGLSGYRGLSVYSATKAALDGFTRSLARELGARNITVNSVAPGYLTTEMTQELDAAQTRQIVGRTPLQRLGDPQDVAEVVEFLASERSAFITGQVIVVDGGLTC